MFMPLIALIVKMMEVILWSKSLQTAQLLLNLLSAVSALLHSYSL